MDIENGRQARNICVLGSTGSIGTQTLDVARSMPELFRVRGLSAQRNARLLADQAREFRPDFVVIGDEAAYQELREMLAGTGIRVAAGQQALAELAAQPENDLVLTAVVGFAGLEPTLAAIDAGKDIALANKETLVVAGELVMTQAKRRGVALLPVDSEHSALFQCLVGEKIDQVTKLVLTASGGPFRGWSKDALATVLPSQALKHPRWNMGAKISVDSATMMNKGLEVIEAGRLFGLSADKIDIIVHPESIVHSLVEFLDGSVKAQLGPTDMRLPIQYALCWPDRQPNHFPRLAFAEISSLHFETVNREVFRSVDLAYQALETGEDRPCVLNAANEIAVQAFLDERIGFTAIYDCIEFALNKMPTRGADDLDSLIDIDAEARRVASQFVGS